MAVTMGTPLTRVLGPKTAGSMADQLGLHTVGDLLRHYPRRYASRGEQADLADVAGRRPGDRAGPGPQRDHPADAQPARDAHRGHGRRRQRAHEAGVLQPPARPAQAQRLGDVRRHGGGVARGEAVRPPRHAPARAATDDEDDWARALVPIYPASKDVSSWVIQKSVKLLLGASGGLESWCRTRCPRRSARGTDCSRWPAALLDIHRPTTPGRRRAGGARLKWDEALVLQLTLAARRRAAALEPGTARPRRAGGLLDAVDAALPFALTEGQREVGEELAAELDRDQPMHRLLQGEVGSGKTVVALRAMAQVVDAGGQAALLAPTEVLAAQHARGIRAAARAARPGRRAGRRRRRHPGRPADRLAQGRGEAAGAAPRSPTAAPASSSAPTPCCRRASTSPTSAWSSSTSSTASASSSATPCAPRATGRRTCWS